MFGFVTTLPPDRVRNDDFFYRRDLDYAEGRLFFSLAGFVILIAIYTLKTSCANFVNGKILARRSATS